VKFLADEHIDLTVIRGLQRRYSDLDIARGVDVGLGGTSDSEVLEWAAADGYFLPKTKPPCPTMLSSVWAKGYRCLG